MNTLDLEEAAKLLHCSTSTVQQKAAAKEIPGTKIGRAWIFIQEDLIAHIRGQYGKENKKGKSWRSTKEVKFTGSTSALGVDQELEKLLG
jgi:excisionase family DNA binding protein